LLTISPYHLWYSQEARMYAPQIFCALAASYFFVLMLRRPTWRVTLGYALASVAIVYFHYHPFFLLAQLVFLIWFRRTYSLVLSYWLGGIALAGLLYAPWFVAVFTTGGLERAPMGWVPATQWYDPILTLYVFWLGATNDPGVWLNWAGVVVVFGIAGFGAISILRDPTQSARTRAERAYLLVWLVLPVLIVWAISLDLPIPQKRSAYVDRFLSPEFPAWLILIALGAIRMFKSRRRLLAIGAAIACAPLVISAAQMYFDPFFARDNWKDVAARVRSEQAIVPALLIAREDQQLPMLYFGLGEIPMEVVRLSAGESERAWSDAALQRHALARRVWLFSGTIPSNVHRFGAPPAQQAINARQDPLKQILDARLEIESEKLYQGIWVTVYRVPGNP
jgi:mannosyltransferase